MAKKTAQPSVVNRHVYARASYLYQAANYLAQAAITTTTPRDRQQQDGQLSSPGSSPPAGSRTATVSSGAGRRAARNLSRRMTSDIRSISLKAQVRHSPAMKSTMCRSCDSLLVEGQTSRTTVENASRGGRKPWADVLTVRCLVCGQVRRYPVGGRTQQGRHLPEAQETQEGATVDDLGADMSPNHPGNLDIAPSSMSRQT
ncbi:ribonuclease P protein subunit RPR2 [Geosmithia morbida]|uniref:Ribonuclease P protein subunit RPR2 n=1 Tax=Geosmithia morbida TaxID=1094350 RepID=A0A9P4YZF6_9HYPO|nr:ribonuclease P protein subunit RPR2 [Geosmithia morbida]KAF4124597.1 ribonuclease P protein subunit RPR2 [Geosmithia morbida]